MKANIRRLLALLTTVMLCLSFVGCGNGGRNTSDGSLSGMTSSLEPSLPTSEDDSGDLLTPSSSTDGGDATTTTTRTKAYMGGQKDDTDYLGAGGSKQEKLFGDLRGTTLYISESDNWFTNNLMKQFEKKYGVKVVNRSYSFAEEQTKLATMVQAGDKKNYLDTVTISQVVALRYIYGNLVIPMDKYIDTGDAGWNMRGSTTKRYEPYILNGNTYGSASNSYGEMGIFYNKSYMQEKGIKDPYKDYYLKNNWNYDTFLQVAKDCKTMSANGKTVKTYGVTTWDYFSFCLGAGNTVIQQQKDGKWKITVDDADGMTGLKLIYDLYKAGTFGHTSTNADFLQRKVAMIIGTPPNVMAGIDAYEVMSDEIGYVPFPKKTNSSPAYIPMSPDGRAIAACSQNPAAAAAWIYEFQHAEEVRDNSSYGLANRRKQISDEHLEIRNQWVKNGKQIWSHVDGLTNWYGVNRTKFLSVITEEGKAPAVAIEQMLPLLEDSLKQTVG